MKELPKWETVIRSMTDPGCVFHFRRATGAYASRDYKLMYSDAAKEASKDSWWPMLYTVRGTVTRPTEDGGTETLPEHLGIRAVCLIPKSDEGTEEGVGGVRAILDSLGISALGTDSAQATAPAPEQQAPSWALATLGWVRDRLAPRPLSAAQDPPDGPCPLRPPADCVVDEIGVTVRATPIRISCPPGFDFDWAAAGCVHTGFAPIPVPPVPPVRIGGGGGPTPPPPPPTVPTLCGDVRDTITTEYEDYGVTFRPTCWDFVSTGGGANFTWKELNGGFSNGNPHKPWGLGSVNTTLLPGLQATRRIYGHAIVVTSGYRCPHGNQDAGGVPQSNHMEGIAADMRSVWSRWSKAEFNVLKEAARDANGRPMITDDGSEITWDTYDDHHLHINY
ncbi:D-Ala-D-Ala carboxypeptidase family metallohydrolase [Candidatus Palauibacter sp.]|uniref:D-Ala-D-Ala carboxypeptidase family metallohydrolase n=1 Tax=Candidatus Palauibacter sp. TaxID=3101350 RepID=UPI003B026242